MCLPHVPCTRCCRLLYISCMLYLFSARYAHTYSQNVVGCRHEFYTLAVGWFSCVLYFSSARCARTHSQSFVGCRHEFYTLAVGFLFDLFFFGSLRSHSFSECCRLQARVGFLIDIFFFGSLRSHSFSECCAVGCLLLYSSSVEQAGSSSCSSSIIEPFSNTIHSICAKSETDRK